ncbi:MAG: arsenic efflux protein [Clostridiales bacterium]|nr:arsenic efflux protein [Clostridiales bacterium]
MADALLDALIDTAKLIPWLLVMHLLIELFEHSTASKIKMNKVLRGPLAPLMGGACGILPQCGFGVVAANLYCRRSIRVGTLIAVFIATSDEAVPILLGNFSKDSLIKLAVLLGFKLVAALLAGYLLTLLLRNREELTALPATGVEYHGCHNHALGSDATAEEEHAHDEAHANEDHGHAHDHEHEETAAGGSEKKNKKFDPQILLHPLVHTLTVTLYILAVNVLFAVILYFVGEQRLHGVLDSAKFFQPLLAGLIGLIPNCASSVVLAQMYAAGNITLGAAFAGLSVNAGLGLAVLLKDNRPFKNTLFITVGLYAYSVVLGLLLTLLPM